MLWAGHLIERKKYTKAFNLESSIQVSWQSRKSILIQLIIRILQKNWSQTFDQPAPQHSSAGSKPCVVQSRCAPRQTLSLSCGWRRSQVLSEASFLDSSTPITIQIVLFCFQRSCNIYFIPANIFFWGQVCSASPSQGWIDCCTCNWKGLSVFHFHGCKRKIINSSSVIILS